MRTSNPTLTQDTFKRSSWLRGEALGMTIRGVVSKTALLLVLTLLTAGWTWVKFSKGDIPIESLNTWSIASALIGFVLAMVTTFKKEWAGVTAPLYAAVEGVFVGAISLVLESQFPGIALQAAAGTFGTLAAMLFLYQSGLIQVTDRFKMIVATATGGIAICYLILIALSFFGVQVSFLTGNGLISILFSVFVIGIAALNFVLDFDFIEKGASQGAPKYLEWYGAFALMVTVIWLYIEFLRLLSKLRGRD